MFSGSAAGMQLLDDVSAIHVDGSIGYVTTRTKTSTGMMANTAGINALNANSYDTLTPSVDGSVPVGVGRIVRVNYPAQSCSPGSRYAGDTPSTTGLAGVTRPAGGVNAKVTLPALNAQSATLRYAVKVPSGFDWRLGGKLPGLSSSSTSASGSTNGVVGITSFTARLMWKAGGRLDTYFYCSQTRKSDATYGVNFNNLPAVYLQTGWNEIEQTITLNRPGQSNGSCFGTLNGVSFIDRGDIEFVDNDTLKIDGAWLCSFFGGNTFVDGDNTWETLVDTYLEFSDLVIVA